MVYTICWKIGVSFVALSDVLSFWLDISWRTEATTFEVNLMLRSDVYINSTITENFFDFRRQECYELDSWIQYCTITVTSWWARWHLKSPRLDCLLNRWSRRIIKENIKALRHWPLWGEFTGEFPAQTASNAEMFPFDDVFITRWYNQTPNSLVSGGPYYVNLKWHIPSHNVVDSRLMYL